MKMHVSLYVADAARTKEFYELFFNQKATKVKSDYVKFELENPALVISFVQNKERVKSNFGHLGFVADSLDVVVNRLEQAKSNNLDVLEEMGTNCCYANQDKFWVTDPDGHQWEIYTFNSDVEFNDPKYASTDATACCTPSVDNDCCTTEEESAACCTPQAPIKIS